MKPARYEFRQSAVLRMGGDHRVIERYRAVCLTEIVEQFRNRQRVECGRVGDACSGISVCQGADSIAFGMAQQRTHAEQVRIGR